MRYRRHCKIQILISEKAAKPRATCECVIILCILVYILSVVQTHTHGPCAHTHTHNTYGKNECSDMKVHFVTSKQSFLFPFAAFFIVSDDKRLNRTGFTLVCQTIRDAMFQTCLVTAMQNQQHSIDLARAASASQEIHFPQASLPIPSPSFT